MALKRNPLQPPEPRDLVEDVGVGLGADLAKRRVVIQFDQHVRAVSMHPDEVIELIEGLCGMLAQVGVIVTRDGPDGAEQTH